MRPLRHSSHRWLTLFALGAVGCGNGNGTSTRADASAISDAQLVAQGCSLTQSPTVYKAENPKSTLTAAASAPSIVGCFRPTGLGSSEISLGIAKDGTVLVAPAYTERGVGVARSSNNGVTWQPLPANFGGDAGHSRVQPFMDLDPTSDRTYFVTSVGVDGPGLDLSLSTDQGTTWTHQVIAPTDSDWMKIFTGPRIATDPGTGTIVYASVPIRARRSAPIIKRSFGRPTAA
jgi:hypothetical protein